MLNIDNFLNKIDKLLMEKRISKTTFYKQVGISSGNFSDWKKGRSKPSIVSIGKIANYFNCSVEFLTNDNIDDNINTIKANDNIENIINLTSLNDEENKLISIFRKLDKTYQEKLIKQSFKLLIEMCQEQDKELNSKKSYIAAFGGGTFEIDEEMAKFIKENAVFKKYKPKEL